MKYKEKTQFRLPWHDYAAPGYYFVTVCTKDREQFFGTVVDGKMQYTKIGDEAVKMWLCLPEIFLNIRLDSFVIMPEHLHAIIEIIDDNSSPVGTRRGASLQKNAFGPLKNGSLSSIMNHYKGAVKKWCNNNGYECFSWQARFFDEIIRDALHLNGIRQYIKNNPRDWKYKK